MLGFGEFILLAEGRAPRKLIDRRIYGILGKKEVRVEWTRGKGTGQEEQEV